MFKIHVFRHGSNNAICRHYFCAVKCDITGPRRIDYRESEVAHHCCRMYLILFAQAVGLLRHYRTAQNKLGDMHLA